MEEDRYTRITLRIPRDLHSRLDRMAEQTSKSLNAEIVGRLEESFSAARDGFHRTIETQVAAIQNRVALLGMRYDLALARVESLQFRSQLLSSDSERLAREAKTDEEFRRVKQSIKEAKNVANEASTLQKEMKAIVVERESALAELHQFEGLMTSMAEELEGRVRDGLAARAAKGLPPPPNFEMPPPKKTKF